MVTPLAFHTLEEDPVEASAAYARTVAQAAMDNVGSWSASIHPRTWEEWVLVARHAMRSAHTAGSGLACNINNTVCVTVSTKPRGSHWSFFAPLIDVNDHDPRVPPFAQPTAWALAYKIRYWR